MAQVFGGIRVVELGGGMAGSIAGMIMADNGAEVIKVEPPGGDRLRQSPGFLAWNRGKKSVEIDLEKSRDLTAVLALVLTADVVLNSFRQETVLRYGLDYSVLSRKRPDLVYCTISGFGLAKGEDHLEPLEELVAAKSGRLNNNDELSGALFFGRPIFVTSPFGSYGAAGLALQGVTAALFARGRTGRGQQVETSLLDGINATTMRLAYERKGDKVAPIPNRPAIVTRGIMLCFMTAKCKDGRYLQMCARQDQHFKNWLNALDLGHLLQEERFAQAPLGFKSDQDIDDIDKLIRERMARKTCSEWLDLFSTRWDVGCDPFLTPEEFLQHPQMVLNDRVAKVEDPAFGMVTQIGPIALFSDTPSRIESSAPTPGQHQRELPQLLGRVPKAAVVPPASAGAISKPPLDGIVIVELASFIAAPLSATLLATLGARVIKIEPLEGDPYRRAGTEAIHLVQGKESIAVDLKSSEGREIFTRVVGIADALVHNFRPDVPERLGVDYAAVSKLNPRLVYLYGASYGSKGPERNRPSFHSTPHALCGGGILQGGVGNPPVDDSYPDPCAAIGAAMALMMGLFARETTGKGQYVETTMLTSSGYVHSERLTHYRGMPKLPMLDSGQFGFHALKRIYPTKNGWLMLSAAGTGEWKRLATMLGHAEWLADSHFADEAARLRNDEELIAALQGEFARAEAAIWERELTKVRVSACSLGASFQEFVISNNLVDGDEHPTFGPYFRHKARVRFSDSPNRYGPPCTVGEHTVSLLEELGYGRGDIDRLIKSNVVKAAKQGGSGH